MTNEADRLALAARSLAAARTAHATEVIADDRGDLMPGDQSLLIVEDDPQYARLMVDLAHDLGLKVLVANRGEDALTLAKRFFPTAVSLDVFLPDMLGWTVLSQLKQDPLTRHIPVQLLTSDEDRQHGLARGAFSFLTKPSSNGALAGPRGKCGSSRMSTDRAKIWRPN